MDFMKTGIVSTYDYTISIHESHREKTYLRDFATKLGSTQSAQLQRLARIWASTRENLSSGCANNTDADQLAHPRRLISAFVIRFLERIISKLATSEISLF